MERKVGYVEGQYEEQSTEVKEKEKLNYKNMIIPIALYALLNQNGQVKAESEDIVRTAEIVKSVKPYFQNRPRELLAKAESILDILQAFNRYTQKEYIAEAYNTQEVKEIPNKPIKVLEAVKPHLKGESKDKVEKLLVLNDRMNRLKESSGEKRNLIEDAENIMDILEVLQYEKGQEIRELLNKTKEVMKIVNR